MEVEERALKRNGFSLPLNGWQIASWLIFTIKITTFYAFHVSAITPDPLKVPLHTFTLQILFQVINGIAYMLVVGLTVVTTCIDPGDPNLQA